MGYIYKQIDEKIEPYFDLIMDCIKLRGGDLDEQIKALAKDTRLMDTCLEEEILQMKLHAAQVRKEFEDTVNVEVEKNTQTWEQCVEKIKSKEPRVKELLDIFKPLSQEVESLNQLISNINIYKLEKLIELAEKIAELDDRTIELVRRMVQVEELK